MAFRTQLEAQDKHEKIGIHSTPTAILDYANSVSDRALYQKHNTVNLPMQKEGLTVSRAYKRAQREGVTLRSSAQAGSSQGHATSGTCVQVVAASIESSQEVENLFGQLEDLDSSQEHEENMPFSQCIAVENLEWVALLEKVQMEKELKKGKEKKRNSVANSVTIRRSSRFN